MRRDATRKKSAFGLQRVINLNPAYRMDPADQLWNPLSTLCRFTMHSVEKPRQLMKCSMDGLKIFLPNLGTCTSSTGPAICSIYHCLLHWGTVSSLTDCKRKTPVSCPSLFSALKGKVIHLSQIHHLGARCSFHISNRGPDLETTGIRRFYLSLSG